MSNIDIYRCEKCGNVVAQINNGGGTLTCCGQAMTKLVANSTDAAHEKHVPVVTQEDGKLKVDVGSTLHPMLEEHYIEWIALEAEGKIEFHFLKPGEEPITEFKNVESGTIFAYCNLHGLWKTDFAFKEDFTIDYEAACSAEFSEGCIMPEEN
jgi:superoxide reductase